MSLYRLLTDFVCLYNYEFWLSLCKIVRSSVILLLPLLIDMRARYLNRSAMRMYEFCYFLFLAREHLKMIKRNFYLRIRLTVQRIHGGY